MSSNESKPTCPYHAALTPAQDAHSHRNTSPTPAQQPADAPVTPPPTAYGTPVVDNQNSKTAGPRGPLLMEDVWLL